MLGNPRFCWVAAVPTQTGTGVTLYSLYMSILPLSSGFGWSQNVEPYIQKPSKGVVNGYPLSV